MAISISEVYSEAEIKESQFSAALTRVAIKLARNNHNLVQKSAPEVELTFMLCGSHSSPGFTGMRIRRFSAKEQVLHIEAAVSNAMVNSADASDYIIAALMDAVENAAEFFDQIHVDFNLLGHMSLIEALGVQGAMVA